MRNKILVQVALATTMVYGQQKIMEVKNLNETFENAVVNKTDLAYKGAPLIVGESCDYKFHEEYNTLVTTCHNNEGMLVGHQVRVIQNPVKQCGSYKNMYQLGLTINELSHIYFKDNNGTYFCCDYFEPGFGYLFTSCGDSNVFIQKSKINSAFSQELLS